MRSAFFLLSHSMKRVRSLVLTMSFLVAGFQILLTLVAKSIEKANAFEEMSRVVPDFLRQLMGPSFVALMSFRGIVCVGYFHIAVMGSLVGLMIALATEPAAEIESGFTDLVLSRPLARHWVITRTLALILLCTGFSVFLMMLGTWAGLYWLAPKGAEWPAPGLIRSLALNLGLLMLCWGGVTAAVSAACRRRSVAGSVASLLTLAAYLLDYLARVWEPAQSVAWLSPFRYYSPLDRILGAQIPGRHLWVLVSVAVAGFALAYIVFARRDL